MSEEEYLPNATPYRLNDLQKLGVNVYWDEEPTVPEIVSKYADTLWVDKDKKILNENAFARMFCEVNKCVFYNGVFFTTSGRETDDTMEKAIWETLESANISTNVANKVKRLKDAIRLAAIPEHNQAFKIDPNVIPFKNGIFNIAKMEFIVWYLTQRLKSHYSL